MSRTSQYRKGYFFEIEIMKKFDEMGYYVIRSAGSHRLCDLIAIPKRSDKEIEPICIQCKKTTQQNKIPKLSRNELDNLRNLEREYNIKVMIALRYRDFGQWITKIITLDEYLDLLKYTKSLSK